MQLSSFVLNMYITEYMYRHVATYLHRQLQTQHVGTGSYLSHFTYGIDTALDDSKLEHSVQLFSKVVLHALRISAQYLHEVSSTDVSSS